MLVLPRIPSAGYVAPIASGTREPTHIMPLTFATRPTQISPLTMRAPDLSENLYPGDMRHLELVVQRRQRCRVEEHRVDRDVEQNHKNRAENQRARQRLRRVAHFLDDIGRRVPAGIGIHHPDQRRAEKRPQDGPFASAACGIKVTGCAGVALKPNTMNATISSTVVPVAAAWNAPVKRRLRRCAAVDEADKNKRHQMLGIVGHEVRQCRETRGKNIARTPARSRQSARQSRS